MQPEQFHGDKDGRHSGTLGRNSSVCGPPSRRYRTLVSCRPFYKEKRDLERLFFKTRHQCYIHSSVNNKAVGPAM